MRRQVLQAGTVPARTRHLTAGALVAVALVLRVWTHAASTRATPDPPVPLRDFLTSPQWPWVDPPLPSLLLAFAEAVGRSDVFLFGLEVVATMIVVNALLALGQRWLDFDAAVLAAAMWAIASPAVAVFRVPGSEGWQAALSIVIAGSMLRVARRRAPELSWRIGASAGALTLFSGGGALWAIGAIAWLPMTSQRFRGWGWVKTAGLISLGWVLVVAPVAVRNAVVSGGDPKLPVAGDMARFHASSRAGTVMAAPLPAASTAPGDSLDAMGPRHPSGPASVAYTDAVLASRGIPLRQAEFTRSTNMLTLALQEASEEGGRGWRAIGRRVIATIGGWMPPDTPAAWGVPWILVVMLAWVGVGALLPGARQLFPFLLGGAIPLLQSAFLGVDTGTLLLASPFVCSYAGYGLWRIWTGRRFVLTWAVAPALLAVALAVHFMVRDWV